MWQCRPAAHAPSARLEWEPESPKRFMKWRNCKRPYISLNAGIKETPALAFGRRMPHPGFDTCDG